MWAFFPVLFLLIVFPYFGSAVSQHKNESSSSFTAADCSSPDTFVCPREGSCIPMEWVGDGEKDCEDGTDEATDIGTGRDDPFAMLINSRTIQSRNGTFLSLLNAPSVDVTAQEELTVSPSFFLPPPLSSTTAALSASCPNCLAPLGRWVAQMVEMLGTIDNNGSSSSIFARPQCQSLLSRACPLLTVCAECPPESLSGPLLPWTRLQLFLCELLEPTLRDHSKCLGAIPSGCARTNSNSVFSPPHCQFLGHSLRSVQCLEAAVPSECSESALEMVGPLRSEAEHWLDELKCLPPTHENGGNLSTPAAPATAIPPDDQLKAFGPPATTLAPFSLSVPSASTFVASPKQKIETAEHSDILWDALLSLARAEQICANGVQKQNEWADGGAVIQSKICDRMDVLSASRHCLEELARREGKKCPSGRRHSNANSSSLSCAIIDNFGKSIDCAVEALNELCPVEVQEAVVAIQEQLNDEAISRQCFVQQVSTPVAVAEIQDEFPLTPVHPKCSPEQEELSLVCLVDLAELNGRLQRLASLQMLIADNATLAAVCQVFARYEQCLDERVFKRAGHKSSRCSLNSPLNALARIGLSPLCSPRSRLFLQGRSAACLNTPLAHCHLPMEAIGRAVGAMLHGVHGQAHMCKAFYSLRAAFGCGQQTMRERCTNDGEAAAKLGEQLAQMLIMLESLGHEEGCPEEEPPQLDVILSRRVVPDRRLSATLPTPPPTRPPPAAVPQARPLPTTPMPTQCDEQQQQQFTDCVQPLTAFQPHPLAVIKQPRLIDQACQAFHNFSECRVHVQCFPLWARGMSAMFEFACGPQGNALYLEVRQCIRRNIARQNIKECVVAFSRGAPQDACPSARRLVDCAAQEMGQRCGERATQFVREYVSVFAKAVDANCTTLAPVRDDDARAQRIGVEAPAAKGPIAALNCSEEQQQSVRHCAAPLEALHAQLGDLFEGGLQSVLKNLNGLAPLFAQGCVLGTQFRQCLSPLLFTSDTNSCVVSSCLVAAGAGICDQPDAAQAIDTHLGCVFRQVSDPEFGKCLRTTLVPIKQFSLSSLRQALPQFVQCVHDIVLRTCGPVPLNVLRVLASRDNICPVNDGQMPSEGTKIATASLPVVTCTPEMKQTRIACQRDFLLAKYAFRPVSLLLSVSNASNVSPAAFCAGDFDALSQCMRRTAPCDAEEPYGHARALRALGTTICSARVEFSHRAQCVQAVTEAAEGQKCTEQYERQRLNELLEVDGADDGTLCGAVNATTQCLAPRVFSDCGSDSLEFVFSATNEYLAQIIPGNGCQLEVPSLAIQHSTGCPEQELVAYLECESHVDHFRPRPLALISNQSDWEQFCHSVQTVYKPCMKTLKCRPEPAAGAALTLYDMVCEREITSRDQRRFGECLLKVTEVASVRPCLNSFRLIDLLGRDAGPRVCAAVNELLQCAANAINEQCGEEALLHVYDVYNGWSSSFHSSCVLSPPNLTKMYDEKNESVAAPTTTTTKATTTIAKTTLKVTTQKEDEEEEEEETSTAKTTTPAAKRTTNGGGTAKAAEKPSSNGGGGGGTTTVDGQKTTEQPKVGANGARQQRQPFFAVASIILSLLLSLLCMWWPTFGKLY